MPSDVPVRCANRAVRDVSLCGDLPRRDLAALHAIGRRRTLTAGQVLDCAGEPAKLCGNLVPGVLKVTRMNRDSRAQIVGLLYPGDISGEMFVSRTSETITPLTPVDLCVFPREALERTLTDHPTIARVLLKRAMATLLRVRRSMPLLSRVRADAKFAALLVNMTERCGEGDGMLARPLSRGAMAETLALKIETVSCQMTALENAGLIERRGLRGIRVPDLAALVNVSG